MIDVGGGGGVIIVAGGGGGGWLTLVVVVYMKVLHAIQQHADSVGDFSPSE